MRRTSERSRFQRLDPCLRLWNSSGAPGWGPQVEVEGGNLTCREEEQDKQWRQTWKEKQNMKSTLGRDGREHLLWMGGNRGPWGWTGFLKVTGLVNGGRKMRALILWLLAECSSHRIKTKTSQLSIFVFFKLICQLII